MIKEELDATLSVDKCSLVSSSVALGRNILKALGSWAGKYNQSPITAAVHALDRIGWKFPRPFVLVTQEDKAFSLADVSP
eukprot:4292316-Pyramimonas_sp.AAC.1